MRIIRAYQRIGRTVAMTGDGANDALPSGSRTQGSPLRARLSRSTRAADLVVLDDRIETVIDAIVEAARCGLCT